MSHKLFERDGNLYHDIRYRDADGRPQRCKRRASSDDRKTASQEGALIEANLMKEAQLGKRVGGQHTFGEAMLSYISFDDRNPQTEQRLDRVVRGLEQMGKSKVKLGDITQSFVDELRRVMFREVKASTVRSSLYVPLTAVLNHAHKRGWCARPAFDLPRIAPTETNAFTPDEAFALVQHAAPHHRELYVFLFGTGCRLSEALYLDWRRIDLDAGTAVLLETETKSRKRRVITLPPAVVTALRQLGPRASGAVFKTHQGRAYKERVASGGQIEEAFASACERAGLGDRGFHPHCTRHSWASWHYCVHKDLLLLKRDGGWATLTMVERYAHLLPQKHRADALRFWGLESGLTAVA
jgi:integrase